MIINNSSLDDIKFYDESLIIDEFPCDNFEVAVLNNSLLNSQKLIFAKIIWINDKKTISALSAEEYLLAIKTYNTLKILFEGEN